MQVVMCDDYMQRVSRVKPRRLLLKQYLVLYSQTQSAKLKHSHTLL